MHKKLVNRSMIELNGRVVPALIRDGFPPHPSAPVAALEMPQCVLPYPQYTDLSVLQRAYYVYWRQEYERGETPHADAAYRFIYACELAIRTETAQELEEEWIELRRRYLHKDSFSRTLAAWITDLRLQQGKTVYDAITHGLANSRVMLDLAVAARVAVPAEAIVPLYSKPRSAPLDTRLRFLLERRSLLQQINTQPILDAAVKVTASAMQRELFENLGTKSSLTRFGSLVVTIYTYRRSDDVQTAIDAIVDAMLELTGRPAPPATWTHGRDGLTLVSSTPATALAREVIVRTATSALPSQSTMSGLFWSIETIWTRETLVALLLVLWLSENKPYVEGRVLFARDLRAAYEAIGEALHLAFTIGSMRKAFWALGNGTRAIWILDPKADDPADIKSGETVARFIKPLQHLLAGSAPRAELIHAICTQLARRTHVSAKHIQEVLTEITGTAPTMRRL